MKLKLFVFAVCIINLLSCNNTNSNKKNSSEYTEDNLSEIIAEDLDDEENLSVEEKNKRYLRYVISEANKEFPLNLEAGITITKMYLNGEYVMYLAECDEDIHDMDLFKLNKHELKETMKEALLLNDDPDIKMLLKVCLKAGKGLGYKYVGNTSGESVSVRFSNDELEELL